MSETDAPARKGRSLRRSETRLPNGVTLVAVPSEKVRGRHWVAKRQSLAGTTETIGEYETWQKTTYRKMPDEAKYGTGGGSYETTSLRTSWLIGAETPDEERSFLAWRSAVKDLPILVRKIVPATTGS
jgi:hypothetical protein